MSGVTRTWATPFGMAALAFSWSRGTVWTSSRIWQRFPLQHSIDYDFGERVHACQETLSESVVVVFDWVGLSQFLECIDDGLGRCNENESKFSRTADTGWTYTDVSAPFTVCGVRCVCEMAPLFVSDNAQ